MVCIACFVWPVAVWIWFQFLFPFLVKLKSIIFPKPVEANKEDESKQETANPHEGVDMSSKLAAGASCPFKSAFKSDKNEQETTETKKSL